MKILSFFPVFLAAVISICSCDKKEITLKPVGYEQVQSATVVKGDIKAVLIDNSALPPFHRAGYNGIAELYHSAQDSNLFVPAYAGFNLEHIFNGDSLIQFYESRVNPMMLFRKSETEVLLYQPVTPISHSENLTGFRFVEPHYIDITFSCVFHEKDYFTHGYAGFFWASYINKPPDRSICFMGIPGEGQPESWIKAYSATHGEKSSHRSTSDNYDLYFAPGFNINLAKGISDYRYTIPFYFGRFHNMALGFFFDSKEIIRLTQSPSGGGNANPAWDFQWIIPEPKTEKIYSFRARLIYKPFTDSTDILKEYKAWK